jgi:hypothetical protein
MQNDKPSAKTPIYRENIVLIEGKDEGISVGGRSICAAITKYLDEVMYKQQNFISQSLEA